MQSLSLDLGMPSARAVTSQKQHHVRRRLTREQSLNGWTHGHRAASCDDRDGWHAWWHTGRDINALTHHGESIGMIAARHGSRYIFDAWCRHGGHLNASTPDGDTIPRILLLRMEQSWKEKEMMASLSMQCQTDDARNHYWEREQEHFMMYTMVTRMLCDAVTHGANILPFMYPTLQMDHRVHDALMKTMRDGMHQHAAFVSRNIHTSSKHIISVHSQQTEDASWRNRCCQPWQHGIHCSWPTGCVL
jgi:hypothetical protein